MPSRLLRGGTIALAGISVCAMSLSPVHAQDASGDQPAPSESKKAEIVAVDLTQRWARDAKRSLHIKRTGSATQTLKTGNTSVSLHAADRDEQLVDIRVSSIDDKGAPLTAQQSWLAHQQGSLILDSAEDAANVSVTTNDGSLHHFKVEYCRNDATRAWTPTLAADLSKDCSKAELKKLNAKLSSDMLSKTPFFGAGFLPERKVVEGESWELESDALKQNAPNLLGFDYKTASGKASVKQFLPDEVEIAILTTLSAETDSGSAKVEQSGSVFFSIEKKEIVRVELDETVSIVLSDEDVSVLYSRSQVLRAEYSKEPGEKLLARKLPNLVLTNKAGESDPSGSESKG